MTTNALPESYHIQDGCWNCIYYNYRQWKYPLVTGWHCVLIGVEANPDRAGKCEHWEKEE